MSSHTNATKVPIDLRYMFSPRYVFRSRVLSCYEDVISKEERWSFEMGNALAVIRDQELFLDCCDNFEGYCRDRWDLSIERALEMIEVARLADHLATDAKIPPPTSESQVLPLIGLSLDDAALTWEEAVIEAAGERVPGHLVRAHRQKLFRDAPAPEALLAEALAAFARAGCELCGQLDGIDPAGQDEESKALIETLRTITETARLMVEIATESGYYGSSASATNPLDPVASG